MENFDEFILAVTYRIADVMREKYVSRADLAKRLDVDGRRVTDLLSGKDNFEIKTLFKIAQALEVPVKSLLPDNGGKH